MSLGNKKRLGDHVDQELSFEELQGVSGGTNRIYGGSGDDTLNGTAAMDIILGMGGDDSISGGEGDDMLYGGAGSDTIYGGDGRNRIVGGEGDDLLIGGNDRDIFSWTKGDGDDFIDGGNGCDVLELQNIGNGTLQQLWARGEIQIRVYDQFDGDPHRIEADMFDGGELRNLNPDYVYEIITSTGERITFTNIEDVTTNFTV